MVANSAEALRLRIVAAIGRDGAYLTVDDPIRHFDGVSFLAQYGGDLFLFFTTVMAPVFWGKIKEEGAKKIVDVAWDAGAETLKRLFGTGASKTGDEQLEKIDHVSAALAQVGRTIEKQYLDEFLAAGQLAVEQKLQRDHLPAAKARRIAETITKEVEGKLGVNHV